MIIDIFSLYYVVYSVAEVTGNEGRRDTMRQLPLTRIALLLTFPANFDQSAPMPRHQEVHHRYRSWIIYAYIYNIYIYTRCTVSVWCLWNPASVFEYSRFSFLFSKLISWHVPIDQWQCRSLAIHLYLCEEVEIQVTQGLLEVGLPLWIAGVVAGELWPLWLMIRSYRGRSGLESHDQMTLEMTQVDESQVKNRRW